jgi:hypothetical protein
MTKAATPPLVVKFGRQTVIVHSLRAASEEWCKYRDANDLGASDSPRVTVFSAGKAVARISYNDRIWDLDGKERGCNGGEGGVHEHDGGSQSREAVVRIEVNRNLLVAAARASRKCGERWLKPLLPRARVNGSGSNSSPKTT